MVWLCARTGGWVKHNTKFVYRLCRDFNIMCFLFLMPAPPKSKKEFRLHSFPRPLLRAGKQPRQGESISPDRLFRPAESALVLLKKSSSKVYNYITLLIIYLYVIMYKLPHIAIVFFGRIKKCLIVLRSVPLFGGFSWPSVFSCSFLSLCCSTMGEAPGRQVCGRSAFIVCSLQHGGFMILRISTKSTVRFTERQV